MCGVSLSWWIPTFYPQACINGDFDNRGIKKMHRISNNEVVIDKITVTILLKWKDIVIQGYTINGTS